MNSTDYRKAIKEQLNKNPETMRKYKEKYAEIGETAFYEVMVAKLVGSLRLDKEVAKIYTKTLIKEIKNAS